MSKFYVMSAHGSRYECESGEQARKMAKVMGIVSGVHHWVVEEGVYSYAA